MKKLVLVLVILLYNVGFGQYDGSNNTFRKSEQPQTQHSQNEQPSGIGEHEEGGPGNPEEPVPIDDYIPLLVMVAFGMIVYTNYRKKKLSKDYS